MNSPAPITVRRQRVSRSAISVRVSTSFCDDEWDRFVAGSPHGFHEQTSLWAQVKAFYGWKPLRLTCSDQQGIIAGAQILVRTVRGGYRVGYASRGPVVPSDDPELIARIIDEICQAARKEKVTYLAIAPPYRGQSVETALRARGFRRKPESLPPGSVMSATLLIDLSHDLDSIHAQTRMQVRQHIRVAQRRGVVVREGGQEDVETFRRLMVSLCERRGVSPTPPERDFFENLWRVFAPRGWVRIFLAEVDGQPVAGNLVFAFGDTARIWKAGWSGEFADRRPNNLVQWEAMRWAKQNGFRYFDPMGIERPLAEQLLTGANIDWAGIAGPSNFKIGYGGAPVVLPETLYRFLSPWPQLFVSIGGQRLLESSRVAQLLERINA
jgi:lipid II:glycine glycyltransferase (peptidoglycan interpeptide bridge formation enzyme)